MTKLKSLPIILTLIVSLNARGDIFSCARALSFLPFVKELYVKSLLSDVPEHHQVTSPPDNWKYWEIEISHTEYVIVGRDKSFDPVLASWLNAAHMRANGEAGLSKISAIAQFVRETLIQSKNTPKTYFDKLKEIWTNLKYQNLVGEDDLDIDIGFDDLRVNRLGDYIKLQKGMCRHVAITLLAALQTEHIVGRFVVGKVSYAGEEYGSRHGWVEFEYKGQTYLVDPSMRVLDPIPLQSSNTTGDTTFINRPSPKRDLVYYRDPLEEVKTPYPISKNEADTLEKALFGGH